MITKHNKTSKFQFIKKYRNSLVFILQFKNNLLKNVPCSYSPKGSCRVLVLGAGGGVGNLASQLALHHQAEVVGVAGRSKIYT